MTNPNTGAPGAAVALRPAAAFNTFLTVSDVIKEGEGGASSDRAAKKTSWRSASDAGSIGGKHKPLVISMERSASFKNLLGLLWRAAYCVYEGQVGVGLLHHSD